MSQERRRLLAGVALAAVLVVAVTWGDGGDRRDQPDSSSAPSVFSVCITRTPASESRAAVSWSHGVSCSGAGITLAAPSQCKH